MVVIAACVFLYMQEAAIFANSYMKTRLKSFTVVIYCNGYVTVEQECIIFF